MVGADSDSGSEPEYSEPKFRDSDDDMGHVQPPLQNVQSSRNSNIICNKIGHLTNMCMRKLQFSCVDDHPHYKFKMTAIVGRGGG